MKIVFHWVCEECMDAVSMSGAGACRKAGNQLWCCTYTSVDTLVVLASSAG